MTAPGTSLPEPVLTVTPNTALDRCLLVPDFALGRTVVAEASTLAMAGKPADASLVLAELGVPSVATGLAGGKSGRRMVRMLRRAGVTCRFLRCPGHTRVNVVIIRKGTGQQGTVTVPSLKPTYADGERLLDHVRRLLPGREWLILGGSLPEGVAPDLYARMLVEARAHGVRSLLDASGQTLMNGLPGRPTVVKPNQVELGAALGRRLDGVADAIEAARELCQTRGVKLVVVTLGEEGSICVTPDQAWRVPPMPVEVVNTAGAGDAFAAGLIKGFLDDLPLPEALRWATAAASAVLLTLGTADCRYEDVQRLLPLVRVERIG